MSAQNPTESEKLQDATVGLMFDWARRRDPRVTGESVDGFFDAIAAANLIAREANTNVNRWIDAANRAGVSWQEIGDALGISKQAAYQKYKSKVEVRKRKPVDSDILVSTNKNTVNELRLLRENGLRGRELIDVGARELVFNDTDYQWDYRRMIGDIYRAFPSDGWQLVVSRSPFVYLKRRGPLLSK